MDEAWDASVGYEFAQTGVLRQPFVHNFGGMEIYFIQPRILLPLVCAGVFKIIGYSIAISRLPSLLMGVLAVVALYHIAEQFFGSKQSFFICLATIINFWFWLNSRRCRPEMYYTMLALLFLWLVISYFRRDRALVAFFAGVTVALASLTHPNGLLITAAISVSWIIWKQKPHLYKLIIWSLTGFVLIILPYVLYALWADSQPNVSFLKQMRGGCLYGSIIVKEMMRWKSFFQLPYGIPIAFLMFTSWLAACWKSTAEDRLIATIAIVYPLSLLLLSVDALADYLVVMVPFFSILIVRFVYRLHEFDFLNGPGKKCYIVRLFVILIYVTFSLPPVVFMLYQQHDADFNNVIDEVTKFVGPESRVYADPVFWVGHDSYIYGPYLVGYDFMTMTYKKAWSWAYSYSFEYAVRASWFGSPPRGFKKLPDQIPDFRSYDFTDILCKMFGTKIYKFYDEYYGPVEIYKLDWSIARELGLKKQDIK